MIRLQDVLFALFGLALVAMVALRVRIAVIALVGAVACGAVYLLAGMLPARHESFAQRVFTTVFLSLVLASLVLIVPGTFGPARAELRTAVLVVAGLLPLVAVGFEVLRTPKILDGIWRYLGRR
jgi:hypothetical protein